MLNAPLPIGEFEELAILIRAHHPLIRIEARETARVDVLLRYLSREFDLPYFEWTHGVGLRRSDQTQSVYGSEPILKALSHIASSNVVAIYHFNLAGSPLDDPRVITLLNQLAEQFSRHAGALIFSFVDQFPKEVADALASVRMDDPTPKEYYEYLDGIIKDIRSRQEVAVRLNKPQLLELLAHLKGLTLMEVRRLITAAIIETGALDETAVKRVVAAKGKSIGQSVGLEYYPAATDFQQIAGMAKLRAWLDKRTALFRDPGRARRYGLSAPRGLLLLGVQGCGKSATAKAVAEAFRLPLLRLDAARLYDKFMGGTERNLAEALTTAERLAPVVLWVDEIEKALSQGGDSDGGTSQRVLGAFLTWLAENQAGVFVVATANNIKRLPPELLRKGRFDEIFFVDLPSAPVRAAILAVHLRKRDRDPAAFDLERLSAATEGFSGGELEQAVVSALFSAFNDNSPLTTELLLSEIEQTKPLSVTMAEEVDALRSWARGRTIAAD